MAERRFPDDCEVIKEATPHSRVDVSAIVPVYNAAHDDFLSQCVSSLLEQSDISLEIVFVDDCSTDGTLEKLLSLVEGRDNAAVLKMAANSRQGAARNRGVLYSSGEYISFIDSDDYVNKGYFSSLVEEARRTGACMIEPCMKLVDACNCEIDRVAARSPEECMGRLTYDKRKKLILSHSMACANIYKADLIKRPGNEFPEKVLYEDNPTIIKWILDIDSIARTEKAVYYYRQTPGSTCGLALTQMAHLNDRKTTSKMVLLDSKAKGVYEQYRDVLDLTFIRLFYINTITLLIKGSSEINPRLLRQLKREMRKQVDRPLSAVHDAEPSRKTRLKAYFAILYPNLFFHLSRFWLKRRNAVEKRQ